MVTRYHDVKAVFRDNILFSPSIALEKMTPAPPEAMRILEGYGYAMNRTMVNEDEPAHMERRRLLLESFEPEELAKHEPTVRALTRRYLDRFIDAGEADLVNEMFREIPLTIALHFLGVKDDDIERLRRFSVAHTINTWGRPTREEQLQVADSVGRFWQAAKKILDEMMEDPSGEGWMHFTIWQHLKHPDVVPESYLRSMMMAIRTIPLGSRWPFSRRRRGGAARGTSTRTSPRVPGSACGGRRTTSAWRRTQRATS